MDPDGEDILLVRFNRSTNTITATYVEFDDAGEAAGISMYSWSASNNVRNELNGNRATPNVKTMPSSGKSEWYFPRTFPVGAWDAGKSQQKSGNPDLGDVFVPTNAHHSVPTYGPGDKPMPMPDKDGLYYASKSQDDTGYGLHYSPSGYTLGCIGFETQEAANEYARLSDKALDSKNGRSMIFVYD